MGGEEWESRERRGEGEGKRQEERRGERKKGNRKGEHFPWLRCTIQTREDFMGLLKLQMDIT